MLIIFLLAVLIAMWETSSFLISESGLKTTDSMYYSLAKCLDFMTGITSVDFEANKNNTMLSGFNVIVRLGTRFA